MKTVRQFANQGLASITAVMVLKVGQRAQEDQLSECRVAHLVGVEEVFARGRCEAEGSDGSCLEPQPVADVMEAQRMGELDKVHRAEVAEHGEKSGL